MSGKVIDGHVMSGHVMSSNGVSGNVVSSHGMRGNMVGLAIDRESLLVEVDAQLTLGELESALASEGLTLGIANLEAHRHERVGAWLAEGAKDAPDPWLDPADHLVAGLDARLSDGTLLSIRPAPRRSTGPDLVALAIGTRDRFVAIERAWLRVHPHDVARPETEPFRWEREPAMTDEETALLDAIDVQMRTTFSP